jgi:diguanylate cyclase (GGDEF)-like protein
MDEPSKQNSSPFESENYLSAISFLLMCVSLVIAVFFLPTGLISRLIVALLLTCLAAIGGYLLSLFGQGIWARPASWFKPEAKIEHNGLILLESFSGEIGAYPSEDALLKLAAKTLQGSFCDHCGAILTSDSETQEVHLACLWDQKGSVFLPSSPRFSEKIEEKNLTLHVEKLCQQAVDNENSPEIFSLNAMGLNIGEIRLWTPGYTLPLNPAEILFVKQLGHQFSLVLANIETYRRLHRQSVRDAQTGLFNKSYLINTLDRELHRARRYKHPIGIIMLSIDQYDEIKHKMGSEACNKVLNAVSGILLGTFRGHDISCRYHEEILVQILPEAAIENVLIRAEQVSEWVSELDIPFRDQKINKLTLSVGISSFPEHADNVDDLIQAAESARYRAQKATGDQIVIAEKIC